MLGAYIQLSDKRTERLKAFKYHNKILCPKDFANKHKHQCSLNSMMIPISKEAAVYKGSTFLVFLLSTV